MLAVIFNVDDEAGMGRKRLGNDEVIETARANPDVSDPVRESRRPGTRASRRP